MNAQELDKILTDHKKWLMNEGGNCADLRYANLSDADLRYANLSDANLSNADLSNADLSDADLRYADLSDANLRYADLSNADLSDANLRYADLRYANLRYANLSNANLSEIKTNTSTTFFEPICPEGDFIGWKKCKNNSIVKLLIPSDAKRSNATSYKCRCDKALVLAIEDVKGNQIKTATSQHNSEFIYEVGKTVSVDNFDDDRWNECSTGIHFFISKNHAKQY